MPEQLKELMARLADEAVPAHPDPFLWQRARRSRRRDRFLTGATVTLAVLGVTGVTLLGVDALRDAAPPADAPTQRPDPGIPSDVHAPVGDGGLELEHDLAVGRASVAIANDTAAFVVSAHDGSYHRLDLPGFDPALYDAGGSEVSGLTLSPDGTKLIYGWQGDSEDPMASGARVVDLLSGEIVTMSRQALNDEPSRLLTWGFSWSPDGRFVMNRVKITDPDDPWGSSPHWGQSLDTETGRPVAPSGRSAALEMPRGDLASIGRIAPSGLEAQAFMDGLVLSGDSVRTLDLPDDEVWVTGRFDASGSRLLVEPDRIAGSVLLVDGLQRDTPGGGDMTTTVLRMSDGPADVELLGWVGPRHALAVLDDSFDDETADLVLLSLDVEAGQAKGTVVGAVTVTGDDADVSMATDLATVKTPTRDCQADAGGGGTDGTPSIGLSVLAVLGLGAAALAIAATLALAIRRRAEARRTEGRYS